MNKQQWKTSGVGSNFTFNWNLVFLLPHHPGLQRKREKEEQACLLTKTNNSLMSKPTIGTTWTKLGPDQTNLKFRNSPNLSRTKIYYQQDTHTFGSHITSQKYNPKQKQQNSNQLTQNWEREKTNKKSTKFP